MTEYLHTSPLQAFGILEKLCNVCAFVKNLLTVSRAGDLRVLAAPEGDVCSQAPATGGGDGKPKSQPGVQPGTAGPPAHPGKNFLRAAQMNMNFATWGHLMMSILPHYSSFTTFSSHLSTTSDLIGNSTPHLTEKKPELTSSLPGSETTAL
ncbi:hypothetical protein GOODEAATRI_034283 [Goodea atripinnis]|uniref:Uncharacterized protein n=1 Tax=Goodea atripinnis TaxID=208336 RepID=A0ABV0PJE9_9TELE